MGHFYQKFVVKMPQIDPPGSRDFELLHPHVIQGWPLIPEERIQKMGAAKLFFSTLNEQN